MDQSFSAGVGNWVADEILHLARVHPATPVALLTDVQVRELWRCMLQVVKVAVDVNADHSKFPKDWLFSWRWSKGKKDKNRKMKDTEQGGMRLPDGSSATLKFITVGGRTSAYIEELQKLPEGVVYKEPVKRGKVAKDDDASNSDGNSDLSAKDEPKVKQETDALPPTAKSPARKRVKRKTKVKPEDSSELSEIGEAGEEPSVARSLTTKRTRRKETVKAEESSDMSEIGGVPPSDGEQSEKKRTSTKTAPTEPLADDAVPEGKPDIARKGRKRAVPAANGTAGDGAATGRRKRQKVAPRVEESSGLSSAEDE
ncbi:hypothetical protein QFC24_007036 [Naganishia onofrii]|uniref:Uncharacterized protein n=1 Tax=Naganishia onofrii TaxID=1851511 RepID=A0ACC2WUK8_9TREE|nr:hypothetical protein QFC24_007036 [Naganishia onofrii]